MIPPEWGGDHGLICEHDGVRQSGREHALQERDGSVKDNTTLTTILDSGVDLVEVDEVGADVMDVVLRGFVEVFLAESFAKLERLSLHVTAN